MGCECVSVSVCVCDEYANEADKLGLSLSRGWWGGDEKNKTGGGGWLYIFTFRFVSFVVVALFHKIDDVLTQTLTYTLAFLGLAFGAAPSTQQNNAHTKKKKEEKDANKTERLHRGAAAIIHHHTFIRPAGLRDEEPLPTKQKEQSGEYASDRSPIHPPEEKLVYTTPATAPKDSRTVPRCFWFGAFCP